MTAPLSWTFLQANCLMSTMHMQQKICAMDSHSHTSCMHIDQVDPQPAYHSLRLGKIWQ